MLRLITAALQSVLLRQYTSIVQQPYQYEIYRRRPRDLTAAMRSPDVINNPKKERSPYGKRSF